MSKAFLYGVGNGSSGSSEEKPNLLVSLVDRTITDVTAEDLQGCTSIGAYVFYYCSMLTSVVIPDSATSIGAYAFFGCSSLTSVVIPDSVTSIGGWAFQSCSSLTSVVIPDSVTSIGEYAFYVCSSLTSVVIGALVTSIARSAFRDCRAMQLYDFRKVTAVPTLSNINAFNGIPSTCKIVVPDSLYDEWIVATNWSTYASNIVKASEYTEA